MIGVGIVPGAVWTRPARPKRRVLRFNRSYEFDSVNDHFPDFVLNEVLPAVQKMKTKDGRPIKISPDGNDHAATGGSTGGIGSFTLAWRRPDQFTRVYDVIGTFVSMRGGHEYPALIRKTDPKPIRIFLEDGSTDAWNPLFGSWYDANLNMESALTFAGYDVAHAWGTHGHNGKPGAGDFSRRDALALARLSGADQGGHLAKQHAAGNHAAGRGVAENPADVPIRRRTGRRMHKGEVYLSDAPRATVYRLGADDKPANIVGRWTGDRRARPSAGWNVIRVGADVPEKINRVRAERSVARRRRHRRPSALSSPRTARSMSVSRASTPTCPAKSGRSSPTAKRKSSTRGFPRASGIAFSPDGTLFFAAENTTKWIYSYVVQPDGTLADKQPYYWLHMTDIPNDSGAEDLAVDTHGNLYAATRMGIQVCDQNGRVRAILPLPTPCGPVRSLCFGGAQF